MGKEGKGTFFHDFVIGIDQAGWNFVEFSTRKHDQEG